MPALTPLRYPIPDSAKALASLACFLIAGCGGNDGGITAPTSGTLEVRAVTSGPDPGEYTVRVDAGPPQAIGANGTLTVPDLDPGSHAVELAGLPVTCTVSGDNPATVQITAGETATLVFTLSCIEPPDGTGSLVVTTSTTGTDPDGYEISVDEGAPQPIASSASLTVTGLIPGPHSVRLTGLAPNCTLQEANPQTVTVIAGSSTPLTFTVTCTAATTPIAFSSNALGLQAIFVVNPDGSGLTSLTPEGGSDRGPVWSPDGSRILFTSNFDLYVMNSDGTGRTRLMEGDGFSGYRWSPDGTMIAFIAATIVGDEAFEDLWVMNADGSSPRELASDAAGPAWSPDGSRLAYFSSNLSDPHVRIINVDGSEDRRLISEQLAAFQPAWSPDGSRIALVTLGAKNLLLVNVDGTGLVNLTPAGSDDDSPTWSPDGSRIAFNTGPENQPLESDIAVISPDGSGRRTLTSNPGFDLGPSWSPDGSRIVFESSTEGNSEIYIIDADGTGQENLSNRPDTQDSEPDWSRGSPGSVAVRMATSPRELWKQMRR